MVCVRVSGGFTLIERRLHVDALPANGGKVVLAEAVSRHVRVLRLRAGDRVQLFDGRGRTAAAAIEAVGDLVTCRADIPVDSATATARIVLVLALPKGGKLDECVRMATELGVHEVALLQAERSVPRWDDDRARRRVERLTRIAAEAAAQCERTDVPKVHAPRFIQELLSSVPQGAMGVAFGARAVDRFVIEQAPEQVWCAIGPEGGFTELELSAFEEASFRIASLGRTILRVDTAVAASLALIGDRLGPLQAR